MKLGIAEEDLIFGDLPLSKIWKGLINVIYGVTDHDSETDQWQDNYLAFTPKTSEEQESE